MKPISKVHEESRKTKFGPPKISLTVAVLTILFVKKIKKGRKKTKHRTMVLNQWVNTEESYRRDIQTAIQHIKKPMLETKLINDKQAQILFPEFEGMVQLSTMMLEVLTKAKSIKNPNRIFIGKQLNSFASGYKLYGSFFSTHSQSQILLGRLSEGHENKMKQIEMKMQENVKKVEPKKENMTIKDCMQQPLYRLFKYVLLFKEYVKKLPQYYGDYEPVTQALKTFHDINDFNNELMKKLEEENKKLKLQNLFGNTLDESRKFISEMQADTIYFRGKLYILSNLIIITKIQSILGQEKEEKHANVELNEFSYVAKQQNLKYFKNILILVGAYQCIHLLFVDSGSRMQVYKCLQKTLRDLRLRSHQRRLIDETNKKKEKKKKIEFTLDTNVNQTLKFQPQFRIQIIGVEVRPISTLSNDTVYVTRFMVPFYYQDEVTFFQEEGLPLPHQFRTSAQRSSQKENSRKTQKPFVRFHSLPFGVQLEEQNNLMELGFNIEKSEQYLCISQRIQIHFSLLEEIYKQITQMCPYDIPNINPITKDVNIYSQGKKKTKFFQMRKFFIEQFFNTIIKVQSVMNNPIWLIQKLRINEDLWNYTTTRNADMKKKNEQNPVDYGFNHCAICPKAKIHSVQEFEHYRNYYNNRSTHRENKSKEKYCFNFYNLMRTKLLSFNYICFNNLERILLFYHNLDGRIDYPFLLHRSYDKVIKKVHIYVPSLEDNFVNVEVDSLTTVGEIVDEIGKSYNITNALDFGLIVKYNGQERILDRDEFLGDTIVNTKIKFQEVQVKGKKNISQEIKQGFFEGIKKWGAQLISAGENRIYFMKIIYLHRSLELKSFMRNPEKKVIEAEKIFWSVKCGLIKLSQTQIIEMAALYYCLKELDKLQYFSPHKMTVNRLYQVIPDEQEHLIDHSQSFKNSLAATIDRQRIALKKNKNEKSIIYSKVIDIVSNKIDYVTFFMPVEMREIHKQILGNQSVSKQCFIGVNYKEFIVSKTQSNKKPIISLSLNEVQFFSTVFSLFITHDDKNLRFDSKLIGHFTNLMKQYQTIHKKFPQHK